MKQTQEASNHDMRAPGASWKRWSAMKATHIQSGAIKAATAPQKEKPAMDKVSKQELRRLAEEHLRTKGTSMALPAYVAYDRAANPAAILSLLDELERLELDNSSLRQDVRNAFDDDLKLATMRDQEAAIMKLEQYRKDALYKKAVEKITVDDAGGMGKTIRWIIDQYVDQLAKEGGANG